MPLMRGGRPLKRWRYVGVFGDELMACFGVVRIGVFPQAFWAVLDSDGMRERTRFAPRAVDLRDGVVRVRDVADLRVEADGQAIAVTNRHGAQDIWTRKTPARVRGTLAGRAVDLPALVDDSAGYHARHTEWEWSAGAGVATSGEAVVWNLVAGVHDAPRRSERTVWLDGEPFEVGPVRFAEGLDAVGDLSFSPEAERVRRDDLLLVASDYRQPFGSFAGTLPDGTELASGQGVMERHRARW
jgi:hypothetical protein